MKKRPLLIVRIWRFYIDGFRQMTIGRTLWLIIGIKLFIMFAILRLFFFQPYYKGLDNQQKADSVATKLVSTNIQNHNQYK